MSRPVQIALAVALVASLAVDLVLPGKEAKHVWEYETFFAWFGLIGCIAIILGSKALGKHLLQRPTTYYDELRGDAEGPASEAAPGDGAASPAKPRAEGPRAD